MTPFEEFRLWARQAPIGERVGTALATILVVVLLGWLLVPGSQHGAANLAAGSTGSAAAAPGISAANGTTDGSATQDSVAGVAAAVPAGGGGGETTPGTGDATATISGPGSANAPVGPGCPPVASGARGITATQIKLAVMLIDIAGPAADNTFGVASPAQQQADYDAVLDSINKGGGIACRMVVAEYWKVNPADQNDQQTKCLDAVQAQPFAVLDPGAYSFTSPLCFPQHQVPYFGGFFSTTQQDQQAYPYLFNLANYDHLYRDTVLGFRDRGAFSAAKGFKKLGFFYRDCHPELVSEELAALHQAGLNDGQIVTYDLQCPTAFATPSDIQAAILKFRSAGVTHVTASYAYGDLANFTNIAEQQNFRPQYLLADDGIIAISYGNLRPNPANIANALAVTAGRYGEERTPGMQPTAGTLACDAIYKSHGLKPTWQADPEAGDVCNEMWMLKAGAEHATVLRNDALAAGLQLARSIDFSYPNGPTDFSGQKVTTGGEFWRVAQFFSDCSCWRVIDATFHPNHV